MNTQFTGTPGPWSVAPNTNNETCIWQMANRIATVHHFPHIGIKPNASLIVAAPDLLNALQNLVEELMAKYKSECDEADWYNNNMDGVGQYLDYKIRPAKPESLEQAEAAINKALNINT